MNAEINKRRKILAKIEIYLILKTIIDIAEYEYYITTAVHKTLSEIFT